ncbi:phosphatidylinositol phosphate synthase [Dermabacteraceae bacterium CCM 9519]
MLGRSARKPVGAAFKPLADLMIRWNISPDAITWAGTALTVAVACGTLIPGYFLIGPWLVTAVVLLDSLDGLVARATGKVTVWGGFLDSTLDRVADAAVIGALLLHFALVDPEAPYAGVLVVFCLVSLVGGMLVSYAKARAESLGIACNVGLMERSDRLVVVLLGTFLSALFGYWLLMSAMALLTVTSLWTVGQRMAVVYRAEGSR